MRLAYAWPTRSGFPARMISLTLVVLVVLLIPAAFAGGLNLRQLFCSWRDIGVFLTHFAVMPDWSYLPDLGGKLWETLEITLLASCLAILFSLPLALLAARNATPHVTVSRVSRLLLCLIRALPELLWALIFVSALGLGSPAGLLAMAIVSVGFMGRFYAESLEVVDASVTEAIRAQGAGWFQIRLYGMLPQASSDMVGSSLYLLDHNLRAATLLGLVGAGGIGYDMIVSLRLFRFDRLLLIMASIFAAIFLLDRLSDWLRRKWM